MSSVIGRGRYARATYPQSAGAGGAASITPLSRQRFIDGDTPAAGPGAADAPFKTIAAFMTSRTNVSVADATANYVGWLMPKIGGYAEAVAFPPYASTELHADSISISVLADSGAAVVGDVTWVNKAGAFTPPAALAILHNVPVTGNITITDDATAPLSAFVYSSDVPFSTFLIGNFDASTATRLTGASFNGVGIVGNVDAGIGTLSFIQSSVSSAPATTGSIVGSSIGATSSIFSVGAITCTSTTAGFQASGNCQFTPGSKPALTSKVQAAFDGPSWESFMRAGGTRTAGTAVLVIGGYNAGIVEGLAALTLAATSVSIDGLGTGTTAGFTGENSGNHYSTSSAVPTSVTLLVAGSGVGIGDTMCISRTLIGGGSGALAVIDGVSALTIGTIPALERGFVMARFDGTNWVFEEGGSLAA